MNDTILTRGGYSVSVGRAPSYPFRQRRERLQARAYSSQQVKYVSEQRSAVRIVHSLTFRALAIEKVLEIVEFFNSALGARGTKNVFTWTDWKGAAHDVRFAESRLNYFKDTNGRYSLQFDLVEFK